jgi:hypothetical protein
MNQDQHIAHQFKQEMNTKAEVIKSHIQKLKLVLPLEATNLTRNYMGLLRHNVGAMHNQNKNIPSIIIVLLGILGLWVMDLDVIANVYNLGLDFAKLPYWLERILLFITPLLIMSIYLYVVHCYMDANYLYQAEKQKAIESQNIILEPYQKVVKMPLKLIISGVFKFAPAFFIIIATIGNIGATSDWQSKFGLGSISWIALFAHLAFIFFAEYILLSIYKYRADKYWQKRHKLELKKSEVEGNISIIGEQWLDQREIVHNQLGDYLVLFRDKFTKDDQATLTRLTTARFAGVEAEKSYPLFTDWPEPFIKETGYFTKKDKSSSQFNHDNHEDIQSQSRQADIYRENIGNNASDNRNIDPNQNQYFDSTDSIQI